MSTFELPFTRLERVITSFKKEIMSCKSFQPVCVFYI